MSINKAWQGRRYATREYKSWIRDCLLVTGHIPYQGRPHCIEIDFYIDLRMDIDNPIKTILDLLCKKGILDDDRYIKKLIINKIVSKDKRIVIRFIQEPDQEHTQV